MIIRLLIGFLSTVISIVTSGSLLAAPDLDVTRDEIDGKAYVESQIAFKGRYEQVILNLQLVHSDSPEGSVSNIAFGTTSCHFNRAIQIARDGIALSLAKLNSDHRFIRHLRTACLSRTFGVLIPLNLFIELAQADSLSITLNGEPLTFTEKGFQRFRSFVEQLPRQHSE